MAKGEIVYVQDNLDLHWFQMPYFWLSWSATQNIVYLVIAYHLFSQTGNMTSYISMNKTYMDPALDPDYDLVYPIQNGTGLNDTVTTEDTNNRCRNTG